MTVWDDIDRRYAAHKKEYEETSNAITAMKGRSVKCDEFGWSCVWPKRDGAKVSAKSGADLVQKVKKLAAEKERKEKIH